MTICIRFIMQTKHYYRLTVRFILGAFTHSHVKARNGLINDFVCFEEEFFLFLCAQNDNVPQLCRKNPGKRMAETREEWKREEPKK